MMSYKKSNNNNIYLNFSINNHSKIKKMNLLLQFLKKVQRLIIKIFIFKKIVKSLINQKII